VPQFDALANLYLNDGVSQQELAERLLVTKGNVTGLVTRLADRGLVERRADPNDKRANRIVLTDAGRTLTVASLQVQRSVIDEMLGSLDPSEHQQLRTLLTRVIDGMDGS
jgi:DNA-binding MarR family transcriptional regulator